MSINPNTSLNSKGYWEPHTSSIDFCESNYLHLPHIVEIHNVWSSIIGLSAVGLFGLVKGNPTRELRYTLTYLSLVVIGIGSACLHGTLHWMFQSSDELPMIYLVLCFSFCIMECESLKGQPKYPSLPAVLTVVAVVNTVIYYQFQHLYLVFLVTFAFITIIVTVGTAQLLYYRERRGPAAKKLFWYGEFFFWGIGVPVWLVDMLACHHVLAIANNGWLLGMTPHIIWHCAAGVGAYVVTTSNCCCRLEVLGIPYKVTYIMGGVLPVIQTTEDDKNKKA